jgi:hypothetical protein
LLGVPPAHCPYVLHRCVSLASNPTESDKNVDYRDERLFRISWWVKLAFIIVELGLVIGFMFSMVRGNWNTSAILEWIVSFFFTFYAMSFILDLWPAVATKNGHIPLAKSVEMEPVSNGTTDVEAANVSSTRYESVALLNQGRAH